MRIPFRKSLLPKDGNRSEHTKPSKMAYLELYTAIHNSKGLTQRQVLELQGLLTEELQNRNDVHKPIIMAD